MTGTLVHGSESGGVYSITLDSQHNRNALSRQLVAELADHLDAADRPGTRAVVISHLGRAFCSGADLSERSEGTGAGLGPFVAVLDRLMHLDIPTVAALNGPARAGGIGLMAACDLVVAHRSVTFALTEVRIGVAAAIISVPILRRVRPTDMAGPLLIGAPFDADEARRIGLITHVTDDVEGTVAELCRGLAMGAPAAVRATKRILREVPGRDSTEAFAEMAQLSDRFFASADAAEGMAAFREKRPPSWQQEIAP